MANILSTSKSRRYPRLGFVIAADRICTRGQEMRFWDTLENFTLLLCYFFGDKLLYQRNKC